MKILVAALLAGLAAIASAAPQPLGDELRLSPSDGRHHTTPQIARTPDGGFVAAWYATPDSFSEIDVLAQVFGPDGAPTSPVIEVNQTRAGKQFLTTVGADANGNFTVAWFNDSAPDYGRRGIYARRYDHAGTPLGDEFRVDTLGHDYFDSPSLSMAPDGRFVIVWFGYYTVYARLYDAAGQPRGAEQVVQDTFGDPHPVVAMHHDGSFVVTFADNSVGPNQAVAVRGFDADGAPVFGRVQASPVEQAQAFAFVPSIALRPDGGFYVAWTRQVFNDPVMDTYVRRFDAAGVPLGEPLRVNDTSAFIFPSVGVDPLGGATVAWPNNYGTLYARQVDPNGAADGGPFVVSASPGYGYVGLTPRAIGYGPQGDFIVAWNRDGAVYGRFYGAASTDPPPDDGEDPPPDDGEPPPDDGNGGGCDHEGESDEDHDNGCGNDDRDESYDDHDRGYGNDEPNENGLNALGRGPKADNAATTAGSFSLVTLLLLLGATPLRRRSNARIGESHARLCAR